MFNDTFGSSKTYKCSSISYDMLCCCCVRKYDALHIVNTTHTTSFLDTSSDKNNVSRKKNDTSTVKIYAISISLLLINIILLMSLLSITKITTEKTAKQQIYENTDIYVSKLKNISSADLSNFKLINITNVNLGNATEAIHKKSVDDRFLYYYFNNSIYKEDKQNETASYKNSLLILNKIIYKRSSNDMNNVDKLQPEFENMTNIAYEFQSLHNKVSGPDYNKISNLNSQVNNAKLQTTATLQLLWHNYPQAQRNDKITNPISDNEPDDYDDKDENGNLSNQKFLNSNNIRDKEDNQKLMRLIMDGLGLQKLPDMSKINISQLEYTSKYQEYLRRMHERKKRELSSQTSEDNPLHIISILTNPKKSNSLNNTTQHRQKRDMMMFGLGNLNKQSRNVRHARNYVKTRILLHFSLNRNLTKLSPEDIEEANVRLMLIHSPALSTKFSKSNFSIPKKNCGIRKNSVHERKINQTHSLNLNILHLQKHGKRKWLDSHKVNIVIDQNKLDETQTQWLQFDVTKAVIAWISDGKYLEPLSFEVQCPYCKRFGARILNDLPLFLSSVNHEIEEQAIYNETNNTKSLMPVLNIIGHLWGMQQKHETRKQQHNVNNQSTESNVKELANQKNYCTDRNQRCCRHTMEVIFKEIKGFEFIIQPKVFDAGYCHGRCPPRYNPAHHHAMLQSLIWKQNRTRAPRPCCAPSKLVELEVLHVDEKDSEKLKISTWTDMRVIECSCS
ncbi:uncharacterized protein LOC119678916 [Teleopsis dalmanni]|uniref:uncharacterized protein LOC119678916 n=1 Tax=Teleopsis dalmanni TaxID=139649 RepID=UPI0018CF003A|nr:uncharacterized protein LOC119678916 [Teleopsis dalmanni]